MKYFPFANIELINQYDEYKPEEGLIIETDVRKLVVEMMIDTGAIRMAINEDIRNKLGLRKGIKTNVTKAEGTVNEIEMVGGIKVKFGARSCYTDAFILPHNSEPLLGPIPLEGMDLAVIPAENKLAYNPQHPDGAIFSLK